MAFFDQCNSLAERMRRFSNPPELDIKNPSRVTLSDICGLCRWFVAENIKQYGSELNPSINADFPLVLCAHHAVSRVLGNHFSIKAGTALFHDLRASQLEVIDWSKQESIFDVDGVRILGNQFQFVGPNSGENATLSQFELDQRQGVYRGSVGRMAIQRDKLKAMCKAKEFERIICRSHLWLSAYRRYADIGFCDSAIDASACLLPSRFANANREWVAPQPPGCVHVPEYKLLTLCVYVPDDHQSAIVGGLLRQMTRVQCMPNGWCEPFADWFEYQMSNRSPILPFVADCPWREWNMAAYGQCDHGY